MKAERPPSGWEGFDFREKGRGKRTFDARRRETRREFATSRNRGRRADLPDAIRAAILALVAACQPAPDQPAKGKAKRRKGKRA